MKPNDDMASLKASVAKLRDTANRQEIMIAKLCSVVEDIDTKLDESVEAFNILSGKLVELVDVFNVQHATIDELIDAQNSLFDQLKVLAAVSASMARAQGQGRAYEYLNRQHWEIRSQPDPVGPEATILSIRPIQA